MGKRLVFCEKGRKEGSFFRKALVGDVLFNSFYHREFEINFAKKGRSKTAGIDRTAAFLLAKGLLSEEELSSYYDALFSLFTLDSIHDFDSCSIEELYAILTRKREEILGRERLLQGFLLAASESTPLSLETGLDQRVRIHTLLREKEYLFIALTEPRLFATAKEQLSPYEKEKKILWIVSDRGEEGLPTKEQIKVLLGTEAVTAPLEKGTLSLEGEASAENAALLVFGESGLLDCRGLLLDSGVFCLPRGYFASALAGQTGLSRPVAVYVPAGYDILPFVPITTPTRLHYLILAKLHSRFGDGVYALSLEELYGRYPEYFFNVYETSLQDRSEKALPAFSPEKREKRSPEELYEEKKCAISEHFASLSGCRYFERLFTEETSGIKGKILVHGVAVKSQEARVIPCGKKTSLRERIASLGFEGTAVSSNFLFFLTPKLATLYNDLRASRPRERAQVDAGHLDYLLEYREGKRVETFPLFDKTCIALKENGEFAFFRFRLGGGKMQLGERELSWKKEDVDPDKPASLPVCIFTPYLSLEDERAEREQYTKAVGEGRVNFVLIQDRIICIREGDVLLPGMGVVVSLERARGRSLLKALGAKPLEDGYYSPEGLGFDLCLDPPEGMARQDWDGVKWAFGGGLSLILDGVGLCDGDHMESWFRRDGWTTPLSRQTQESTLHSLVKHPRTAVGNTKNGELVILVFSGRTAFSDGADYGEMCRIARILCPDIQNLMNVDGGGSAMLGLAYNGSFTELSLPSTSTGSTAGQVRPIHTTLFVPIKDGKKN